MAPPLKNEPVPTCNQLEPGSASSKAAAEITGVAPLTCHNANRPLVFCKLIFKSELLTKTATLLLAEADELEVSVTDHEIVRLLGFNASAEAKVIEFELCLIGGWAGVASQRQHARARIVAAGDAALGRAYGQRIAGKVTGGDANCGSSSYSVR